MRTRTAEIELGVYKPMRLGNREVMEHIRMKQPLSFPIVVGA